MSSKIKKWNFGKIFISNGSSCSGCNKPNLAEIVEPKPKIPIQTINPSPNICHNSSSSCHEINGVHSMDDDFDQDDQTSTTFSIDIGSLSPPSCYQNDDTSMSQSEASSRSKVCTCAKIGNNLVMVKNLDDPFQDNHTSTPLSIINIDSLSPPSSHQNDDINLTLLDAYSESKVSSISKIDGTLVVVKNSDDSFQDNHTSKPFSTINIDSSSLPSSYKNDDIKLSQSKANSESKVSSSPKFGDTSLAVVNNLDGPFQDNHTSTTSSIKTEPFSTPSSNQNECTNLSQSEANSEFRIDSCPKISSTLAIVINSDDPFQEFKKSMLQMIFENEIYSPEDLEELLNCFLQLNSPSHHYIIIQAFMEILNNNGKVVSEGPRKKKQPKGSCSWK